MSQNLVSAELTEQTLAEVIGHLNAAAALMPFLLDLEVADRRSLLIMGSGSLGFAEDAVDLTQTHPDILPRSFDTAELLSDRALYSRMIRVQNVINHLNDLVNDTTLAVGSDLMQGALDVYTFAKASGKGAGLEERVKSMGKRFAKRRKAKDQGGAQG